MRPYNRSLHPDDYGFLQLYVMPLMAFQSDMAERKIPHREWHPHRFWEYASIMQQLIELQVPFDAELVDAQRKAYGVALLMSEDISTRRSDFFDVTLCISTIEHADDHDATMRELVRITKPGGYIFITSDYFRDLTQWQTSPSRHLQVTPYTEQLVQTIPSMFGLQFVGATDFVYGGDFVHNYSFVNLCLRKP